MRFKSSKAITTGLAAVIAMAGCAGGGPDLHGPEGPALLAAYSGGWVLDPGASDDLGEKLRGALRSSPDGLPPGMTGGRRMPTGGGRRGGGMRGGMGGTQIDPEAMRAAMGAIRSLATVPQELTLTLLPDRFTLAESASNFISVGLDAEKEDFIQAGVKILGSAKWKKEGVELTREADPAGAIKDTFSLTADGDLVLQREVDLRSRSVKGTLVYRRN